MRILLIATNQADRYMNRMAVRPLPVGLAYVAAHVSTAHHDLQVLDLMFAVDPEAETLEVVQRFQPEVIGLSIRNLDNQSYLQPIWHLPAVRDLIKNIRSVSKALIVCGGPAFSVLPAACFAYLEPDYGIAGHAAELFARFVERLDSGLASTDLPAMVYRSEGRIVVGEDFGHVDFQTPPRLDLLDLQRYDKAGFGIGVVTKLAPYGDSRGGQRGAGEAGWHMRPVAAVIEELQQIQHDWGIRKVFFIDSGFNMPLSYAKELCHALIRSGLQYRWSTYLRVGACDAELIDLMQRAGCALVLLTGVREHAAAKATLCPSCEQIQQLATLCEHGKVPFTLTMDFGGVGETQASVAHKLDLLRATPPAFATLRVATRILPHTPLAATALSEGLINSPDDLIRPTFYLAPAVRDWLPEHLRTVAAAYPRWHVM